ncbi:MAG: hypothetical protein IKG46_11710 [Solobacterium sp.]|nr:hypothetical protein [Solobacterium sp.]
MSKKFIVSALALVLAAGCSAEKPSASSTAAPDNGPKQLNAFSSPSGGLFQPLEPREASELSDEEQASVDRAIRAYVPTNETLLRNDAKSFYYYEKLDDEAKQLYDAMYMVCEDPANEDNIVVCTTGLDPKSQEFMDAWGLALYAMEYDHAELFWMYNEIETEMYASVPKTQPSTKYNTVYFYLKEPYKNYETEMAAFNKAVDEFLKDIDTKKSDDEIAEQIHDKLIDLVTYDYDVMNNSLRDDLAHTAYGVLVENSRGDKNYAVCDGYSQAYVYLLQQCGIDATVILGDAGATKADAGGHAWSVVNLDDQWYEVDSTWDDKGNLLEELKAAKDQLDQESYDYYMEALTDQDYMDAISHYLYNVTTKEITDYTPAKGKYEYYTKDGKYVITLVGSGVHIRDSENKDAGFFNELMNMAPVAEGVKYARN